MSSLEFHRQRLIGGYRSDEELARRRAYAHELGQRLRETRLSRALTQEQLGAYAGVSAKQVGRWERGNSVPHPLSLTAVAAALDCAIEDLTGERSRHGS